MKFNLRTVLTFPFAGVAVVLLCVALRIQFGSAGAVRRLRAIADALWAEKLEDNIP